jgi:hypothetical protein
MNIRGWYNNPVVASVIVDSVPLDQKKFFLNALLFASWKRPSLGISSRYCQRIHDNASLGCEYSPKDESLRSRTGNRSTEHAADQYCGLLDGLVKMAQREGVTSLWNGAVPSLMLVSNPAIQFMTYEAIKRRLYSVYGKHQLSAVVYFLAGAVTKAVATVITYPLQLVQTKLRHGHNYQDLPQSSGTVQLELYILKKYGNIGLYKGMEAKLLQTILTAELMFAAYEKIANFVFRLLLNQRKVSLKQH